MAAALQENRWRTVRTRLVECRHDFLRKLSTVCRLTVIVVLFFFHFFLPFSKSDSLLSSPSLRFFTFSPFHTHTFFFFYGLDFQSSILMIFLVAILDALLSNRKSRAKWIQIERTRVTIFISAANLRQHLRSTSVIAQNHLNFTPVFHLFSW